MKKGFIFTSPGSDPGAGRPLADPIFGRVTTMGACRPDLRRRVREGDFMFVLSGKLPGVRQYLIGGLSVAEKLPALEARARFPDNTLKILDDGTKSGNVIITPSGKQDPLDRHPPHTFEQRVKNYIVANEAIYLQEQKEIELARERTLDILRGVFDEPRAKTVHNLIYRGRALSEEQVSMLVEALQAIKRDAARPQPGKQ